MNDISFPPYCVVLIKPLSIGRGHGPQILTDLLDHLPIVLCKMRSWVLCSNTWKALLSDDDLAEFNSVSIRGQRMSWACLFTHLDRQTDPTDLILNYCGLEDRKTWSMDQLRYQYSGFKMQKDMMHPSDTVFHISESSRALLEAQLLFTNFDERMV